MATHDPIWRQASQRRDSRDNLITFCIQLVPMLSKRWQAGEIKKVLSRFGDPRCRSAICVAVPRQLSRYIVRCKLSWPISPFRPSTIGTVNTHANVFFVSLPGGISKEWRHIVLANCDFEGETGPIVPMFTGHLGNTWQTAKIAHASHNDVRRLCWKPPSGCKLKLISHDIHGWQLVLYDYLLLGMCVAASRKRYHNHYCVATRIIVSMTWYTFVRSHGMA